MMKIKLILDFDKKYELLKIPDNTFVLTADYNRGDAVNINNIDETDSKNIFDEFQDLIKGNIDRDEEMLLYKTFFYPLGLWINAIKKILETKTIDEVIFTSYSDYKRPSLFEAEGESNNNFLYHRSFFISYYIKNFLDKEGIYKYKYDKNRSLQARICFIFRSFLVISMKFFQIFAYKLFVFNRVHVNLQSFSGRKVTIISSRGIIQSQFLNGFYRNISESAIILINESSVRPLLNYRYLKKNRKDFIFCEGNISLLDIWKIFSEEIASYFKSSNLVSEYFKVRIDINCVKSDLAIHKIHMKTYALSVKKTLEELSEFKIISSNIISFEMMSPFSLYLKIFTKKSILQIQTAAIFPRLLPDYSYVDKFIFNSVDSFQEQIKINGNHLSKSDYINGLKYFGLKKKERINKINTVCYFTQPIFYYEEELLVKYLIKLSKLCEFNLTIKLHPRSEYPNYLSEDIEVIPSSVPSQDVVISHDMIITRNSSVGHDAWALNTPVLFFLIGTLKSDKIFYIPNNYKGVFNSFPDICELKDDINLIMEDFYNHELHLNFKYDELELKSKLNTLK